MRAGSVSYAQNAGERAVTVATSSSSSPSPLSTMRMTRGSRNSCIVATRASSAIARVGSQVRFVRTGFMQSACSQSVAKLEGGVLCATSTALRTLSTSTTALPATSSLATPAPLTQAPAAHEVHLLVERAIAQGQWHRAVCLFQGAIQLGCVPLTETYGAVLRAVILHGGAHACVPFIEKLGTSQASRSALYCAAADALLTEFMMSSAGKGSGTGGGCDEESSNGYVGSRVLAELLPLLAAARDAKVTVKPRHRLVVLQALLDAGRVREALELAGLGEASACDGATAGLTSPELALLMSAAAECRDWRCALQCIRLCMLQIDSHSGVASTGAGGHSKPALVPTEVAVVYLQAYTNALSNEHSISLPAEQPQAQDVAEALYIAQSHCEQSPHLTETMDVLQRQQHACVGSSSMDVREGDGFGEVAKAEQLASLRQTVGAGASTYALAAPLLRAASAIPSPRAMQLLETLLHRSGAYGQDGDCFYSTCEQSGFSCREWLDVTLSLFVSHPSLLKVYATDKAGKSSGLLPCRPWMAVPIAKGTEPSDRATVPAWEYATGVLLAAATTVNAQQQPNYYETVAGAVMVSLIDSAYVAGPPSNLQLTREKRHARVLHSVTRGEGGISASFGEENRDCDALQALVTARQRVCQWMINSLEAGEMNNNCALQAYVRVLAVAARTTRAYADTSVGLLLRFLLREGTGVAEGLAVACQVLKEIPDEARAQLLAGTLSEFCVSDLLPLLSVSSLAPPPRQGVAATRLWTESLRHIVVPLLMAHNKWSQACQILQALAAAALPTQMEVSKGQHVEFGGIVALTRDEKLRLCKCQRHMIEGTMASMVATRDYDGIIREWTQLQRLRAELSSPSAKVETELSLSAEALVPAVAALLEGDRHTEAYTMLFSCSVALRTWVGMNTGLGAMPVVPLLPLACLWVYYIARGGEADVAAFIEGYVDELWQCGAGEATICEAKLLLACHEGLALLHRHDHSQGEESPSRLAEGGCDDDAIAAFITLSAAVHAARKWEHSSLYTGAGTAAASVCVVARVLADAPYAYLSSGLPSILLAEGRRLRRCDAAAPSTRRCYMEIEKVAEFLVPALPLSSRSMRVWADVFVCWRGQSVGIEGGAAAAATPLGRSATLLGLQVVARATQLEYLTVSLHLLDTISRNSFLTVKQWKTVARAVAIGVDTSGNGQQQQQLRLEVARRVANGLATAGSAADALEALEEAITIAGVPRRRDGEAAIEYALLALRDRQRKSATAQSVVQKLTAMQDPQQYNTTERSALSACAALKQLIDCRAWVEAATLLFCILGTKVGVVTKGGEGELLVPSPLHGLSASTDSSFLVSRQARRRQQQPQHKRITAREREACVRDGLVSQVLLLLATHCEVPWQVTLRCWWNVYMSLPFVNWQQEQARCESIGQTGVAEALTALITRMNADQAPINALLLVLGFAVTHLGLWASTGSTQASRLFSLKAPAGSGATDLYEAIAEAIALRPTLTMAERQRCRDTLRTMHESRSEQHVAALALAIAQECGMVAEGEEAGEGTGVFAPHAASAEHHETKDSVSAAPLDASGVQCEDELDVLAVLAPLLFISSPRQLEQLATTHFGGRFRGWQLKALLYRHAQPIRERLMSAAEPSGEEGDTDGVDASLVSYLVHNQTLHVAMCGLLMDRPSLIHYPSPRQPPHDHQDSGAASVPVSEEEEELVTALCTRVFDGFLSRAVARAVWVQCGTKARALASARWPPAAEAELCEAVVALRGRTPPQLTFSSFVSSRGAAVARPSRQEIAHYWSVYHPLLMPELRMDGEELCCLAAYVPRLEKIFKDCADCTVLSNASLSGLQQQQQQEGEAQRDEQLWELASEIQLRHFDTQTAPAVVCSNRQTRPTWAIYVVLSLTRKALKKLHTQLEASGDSWRRTFFSPRSTLSGFSSLEACEGAAAEKKRISRVNLVVALLKERRRCSSAASLSLRSLTTLFTAALLDAREAGVQAGEESTESWVRVGLDAYYHSLTVSGAAACEVQGSRLAALYPTVDANLLDEVTKQMQITHPHPSCALRLHKGSSSGVQDPVLRGLVAGIVAICQAQETSGGTRAAQQKQQEGTLVPRAASLALVECFKRMTSLPISATCPSLDTLHALSTMLHLKPHEVLLMRRAQAREALAVWRALLDADALDRMDKVHAAVIEKLVTPSRGQEWQKKQLPVKPSMRRSAHKVEYK